MDFFYICKGEANTTLSKFEEAIKSLQDIITNFKKHLCQEKSLVADRKALENFVRQEGEPLEIRLQRHDLVVNQITHLHSETAWPIVRQGLKRANLKQIIANDTRIYIQNEEDKAIKSTGMPNDFEKQLKLLLDLKGSITSSLMRTFKLSLRQQLQCSCQEEK